MFCFFVEVVKVGLGHVLAAIRCGALGFVDKREGSEGLLEALRLIERGQPAFQESVRVCLRELARFDVSNLRAKEVRIAEALISLRDTCSGRLPENKELQKLLGGTERKIESGLQALYLHFDVNPPNRYTLYVRLKERGMFPGVPMKTLDQLVVLQDNSFSG